MFKAVVILCLWALFSAPVRAQFLYDQESSTDETPFPAGGAVIQQLASPYGQSFTPLLAEVGFIRLKLTDHNPTNALGAALYISVRSNAIDGPLLGLTELVSLTNGFSGVVDFTFGTAIPIAPGVPYFFQPVVQSGDLWRVDSGEYRYSGGTAFFGGAALPGSDLWFREGVVVPEPSAMALVLVGAGALAVAWRRRR